MNLVTVPGDIPGLLREGAKVRRHEDPTTGLTQYGVVVRVRDDSIIVASASFGIIEWPLWLRTKQVDLLLSEPAGRDIAARWIAEQLGLEVGLTAPTFDMLDSGAWVLTCGWEPLRRWFFHPDPDYGCGSENWTAVPSLPADRAKGAEALRLCVLALAGRAA